MHIMTKDGWRSLNGFADRVKADWEARHTAINRALANLSKAQAVPAVTDFERQIRHSGIMSAYSRLHDSRDALIGSR